MATSLPGQFYAHYFQLLIPPLCLGVGWLFGAAGRLALPRVRWAAQAVGSAAVAVLFAYELRIYPSPPEEVVEGSYQQLYLETERLGRRLRDALRPDEVLSQWGNETGLYRFADRRPPSATETHSFGLIVGPQATRLSNQALQALRARPPDLIVAVNYLLEGQSTHPVSQWIESSYSRIEPTIPGEARYFTFFVSPTAPPDLRARVVGSPGGAGCG